MLDFAADWCLPCKELEHKTFTDAAVVEAGKAGLRVASHAHGSISIRESARAGVASVEHGAFIDEPAIRDTVLPGA